MYERGERDGVLYVRLTLFVTLLVVCLLGLPVVEACERHYDVLKNVTIFDTIVNFGEGATCTISLYNETDLIVENASMSVDALKYTYEAGVLPEGAYKAPITCDFQNTTFVGECQFEVGDESVNPLFILYFFGVFFLVLGLVFKSPVWYVLSAAFWMISAASVQSESITLATIFFLVSIAMIILSYVEIKKK